MSKNTKDPLARLITLEKDARNFGFCWSDHQMLYEQMISECKEVMDAIKKKEGDERIQEEIGDVIHTALAWSFFAGYDVQQTIDKVAHKFEKRMQALKEIAHEQGLDNLHGKSIHFLLKLWEKAKKKTSESNQ